MDRQHRRAQDRLVAHPGRPPRRRRPPPRRRRRPPPPPPTTPTPPPTPTPTPTPTPAPRRLPNLQGPTARADPNEDRIEGTPQVNAHRTAGRAVGVGQGRRRRSRHPHRHRRFPGWQDRPGHRFLPWRRGDAANVESPRRPQCDPGPVRERAGYRSSESGLVTETIRAPHAKAHVVSSPTRPTSTPMGFAVARRRGRPVPVEDGQVRP